MQDEVGGLVGVAPLEVAFLIGWRYDVTIWCHEASFGWNKKKKREILKIDVDEIHDTSETDC